MGHSDWYANFSADRHCKYRIALHVYWCTKRRRHLLNPILLCKIKETIAANLAAGCHLGEFGGETDHLHVLITITPATVIRNLIATLKSKTAVLVNAELSRVGRVWSRSYFVSSAGGVTIETLRKYVADQGD